ncbi:Fanconi anemia group E protein [Cololabis saira]|uniref:Fanconi anemia group E protein n=1 Tax=Cololabis saira TaxID=129043 RepID=UPI002AD2C594|nr:Fanconi anemia group E protein [Cololabis saira]
MDRLAGQNNVTTGHNSAMLLSQFDGPARLLLQALLAGPAGLRRALAVWGRQQRAQPGLSLGNILHTLCRDEISPPQAQTNTLSVKPLVCLFSASFKQNLLSFICLIHSVLPETTVLHLLKCLSQDPNPNPWVTALSRQLERKMATHHDQPLYTTACSQRLQQLSDRLVGSGETEGWAKCFGDRTVCSGTQKRPDSSELGTQRKRKSSFLHLDEDNEEMGQQSKRIKTDICDDECIDVEGESVKNVTPGGSESAAPAEMPSLDNLHDSLPEHMKAAFLQIKELLESQTDLDQDFTNLFKVLNECDLHQMEVFCHMLSLPDLPERTLPKLCNSILSLSPDMSYSAAASLIKSLLLERVLSLSEPASRCLITAVTSLGSRYPRPMCQAVVGPIMEDKNIGLPQAELLNRLIEGSLESHYRLLVLQMTLKIAWNEAVLSIIHSLLDSKPSLNEDIFTQFTEQLVSQGAQFTKSVKFAKMMLTVLTKYSSHVTDAHKHSLSSCLMSNETFLKKPLQAALKRIAPT